MFSQLLHSADVRARSVLELVARGECYRMSGDKSRGLWFGSPSLEGEPADRNASCDECALCKQG